MRAPRVHHAIAASAALLAVALVSGCSLLLDVQVAQAGPCESNADCPTSEFCAADLVCRTGIPADASVEVDSAAGPDGPPGVIDAGEEPQESEARESGALEAASEAASASCSSPDDGSSGGCDPQFTACIDGTCRRLFWASPENSTDLPQPAPLADQMYAFVPKGNLYAQHVHVVDSGWLLRLGMLLSPGQTAASFQLGLYADNGGYPSSPLVISDPTPSAASLANLGRQEVTVPRIHLSAGMYWVAFESSESIFVFQYFGPPVETAEAYVSDSGPAFPAPFPVTSDPPNTMPDNAIVIYAVVASDQP